MRGQAIGARHFGDRMGFLDRLTLDGASVSVTSAGCPPSSGRRPSCSGLTELIDVPRDRPGLDRPGACMDITVVTSATTDEEGAPLPSPQPPFKED